MVGATKKGTIVAPITKTQEPGRRINGEIAIRLVCGEWQVVLTVRPELAVKLAEGLRAAAQQGA